MLQVKRLKEHLYTKVLNLNQQQDTNNNPNNTQTSSKPNNSQILEIANRTIELICSDQVKFFL